MIAAPAGNLAGHLRALAAASADGTLSVETFMRDALGHPRWGYYAGAERRTAPVGRRGDFSTAATLHPALGEAVAAWAWTHREEAWHADSGHWHVIELGGGTGQLAATFLKELGWWRGRKLRYGLVEISPTLREQQQTQLARWRVSGTVRWHENIAAALAAAGGRALIFSNEFVDAFPCLQLVRDPAAPHGWREVRLAWRDGRFLPVSVALTQQDAARLGDSRLTHPSVLETAATKTFAAGQHVEVHLTFRDWLHDELLPSWRAGRVLTIDYGDELPALYHRRLRGTLRAYSHHLRVEPGDPAIFAHPGQQDMTADVNFTDLRRWGKALGLREPSDPTDAAAGLSNQRDFLLRWLTSPLRADDPALQFLLDPLGAGGAIRVLEQIRDDASP